MDRIRAHHRTVLALVGALVATPLYAVDGVIEINQARALAGGVTASDGPGFPVILEGPGSYRLTGDLTVPTDVEAIRIRTAGATLDLNGFTVHGAGGDGFSDGIAVGQDAGHVEVRGGSVRGFSRHGIFAGIGEDGVRVVDVRSFDNGGSGVELQGSGSQVVGVTASGNGGNGIRVDAGSLVLRCVSLLNGASGLIAPAGSAYGETVAWGNGDGDPEDQVLGTGVQLGDNVCGTDACP